MQDIKWIIQKDIFGNESKLIKVLDNSGTRYELMSKQDIIIASEKTISLVTSCDTTGINKNSTNAFFYGSTHMMPRIERETKWQHCCTLKNYECHKYYPIFREYLLNKDYYFLPFGELECLNSARSFGNKVFIKPDKAFKTFSGHVVNLEDDWSEGLDLVDEQDLILVTSPKEIKAEYRFVICKEKIVSASQYFPEQNNINSGNIFKYVSELTDRYQPDPIYTIDIADTCSGYKMLEMNSMSCTGLYECDLEKVVECVNNTVSELIEDEICYHT